MLDERRAGEVCGTYSENVQDRESRGDGGFRGPVQG